MEVTVQVRVAEKGDPQAIADMFAHVGLVVPSQDIASVTIEPVRFKEQPS